MKTEKIKYEHCNPKPIPLLVKCVNCSTAPADYLIIDFADVAKRQ